MKWIFIRFLLLLLPSAASGQFRITGKVVRLPNNEPVSNASVYIANSSIGTVSNDNGTFNLSLPGPGPFNLVISHIGFETRVIAIPSAPAGKYYLAELKEKEKELPAVVIEANEKNGWNKWGDFFTASFIGTSRYGAKCVLLNKKAVKFRFSKKNNELIVYADEPLVFENQLLGYQIKVDLVKYRYSFTRKYLYYEIYPFFMPLQAESKMDIKRWERNRLDAYTGSPMHFFRSLFQSTYASEGFEIRKVITKDIPELNRIEQLYTLQADSSGRIPVEGFEKTLPRDTVQYYHKILALQDSTSVLLAEPITAAEIISTKDSTTLLLHFQQQLQVTYTKKTEPREYLIYTGAVYNGMPFSRPLSSTPGPLTSQLELTNGIPVEIYANGSIKNNDLSFRGYFAWWNKVGTLLPLDYTPPGMY